MRNGRGDTGICLAVAGDRETSAHGDDCPAHLDPGIAGSGGIQLYTSLRTSTSGMLTPIVSALYQDLVLVPNRRGNFDIFERREATGLAQDDCRHARYLCLERVKG